MHLQNVVQMRSYLRNEHCGELHLLQLQLTKLSTAGGAMSCPCGSRTTSNTFPVTSHPHCLGSRCGGVSSPSPFHNAVWKYACWQWSLKAGDVGSRLHNFWEISSFPTNFLANIRTHLLQRHWWKLPVTGRRKSLTGSEYFICEICSPSPSLKRSLKVGRHLKTVA